MQCVSCKHLTESNDPGGGPETGGGSGDSLSCGLGKWFLSGNQLTGDDLRQALKVAAACDSYQAEPSLLHRGVA